jgi:hypothetical protein
MNIMISLQVPSEKKYKTMAYNGCEMSLRQPEEKKIERGVTLENLEEGSQVLRRKKNEC